MKKKITNREIMNILQNINKENGIMTSGTKLPIKFLWKLNNNIEKLNKIAKRYQEMQSNLLSDYLTDDKSEPFIDEEGNQKLDEGGNPLRLIKQDFKDDYIKEVSELLSLDTEVDIETFPVGLLENYEFSVEDFISFAFMLVEDTE